MGSLNPLRAICALGALGLAACGGHQPQIANSPPVDKTTYVSVTMDNALREACRDFEMPDPRFEFDSAKLDSGSKAMLAGFATCLTGPMAPVRIRLVGQADPRGSSDYNLDLGLERARSVRDVLVDNGVAANRIAVVSIGEGDASTQRPWYDDRKVAIDTRGEMAPPDADDYRVTRVTIYGEGPDGSVLVFEEREDVDGDGADEPALYYKAETGTYSPFEPSFTEDGDPDGDGVEEPTGRG